MGPKTLPTIWGTYMKLVTKYQISAINSFWEKCNEKCAYMFNVYKNQLSRHTGSRNLTGPKTLPTIWYTYMTLVTKYQISAINSYWEKCDEKYLGRTDRRTEVKQYTPLPLRGAGDIIKKKQALYCSCTLPLLIIYNVQLYTVLHDITKLLLYKSGV
jgi:hypothetical protein